MRAALAIALLLLVACGGPGAPALTTVTDAIGAQNVQEGRVSSDTPVPQSYTTHARFEVAGKPGQVFICDTKRNCDALYAYFDALKALAGPYTYRSDSGLVVVQLNSKLPPDEAAKIAQAIKGL